MLEINIRKENEMKLKDTKVIRKKELQPCELCGRRKSRLSSVNWTVRNVNHCYRGSRLPFQQSYKIKACQSCLHKVVDGMDELIKKLSNN
jgi:hypothetical protein